MKLSDFTLDGKNLNQFFAMHPGPFAYFPGTNGVDDTFDVHCTKTERYIVSTHYWEERERAESIAAAITVALNRLSRDYGQRDVNTLRTNRPTLATFMED